MNGLRQGDQTARVHPQGFSGLKLSFNNGAACMDKAEAVAVQLLTLFGPDAIEFRLQDSAAKALITDKENLSKIWEIKERLPGLKRIIAIDAGREEGAMDFWQSVKRGSRDFTPVRTTPDDPALIIYTSGTTGQPKGVVRDNGGHAVAMHWSMGNIYGVEPGDVYWAASDVGWVVGHSYIVYAPLLRGCTTLLYEGKPVGTPDAGAFWRVISEHRVRVLFTAPTAFRAIKKVDPGGEFLRQYDLSCMDALFLAGERCDPDTLNWAVDILGVPVIRPKVSETTALGAAYAAGMAVGFWSGADELRKNWAEDKTFHPAMASEVRKSYCRQWKKAVERTFDWIE